MENLLRYLPRANVLAVSFALQCNSHIDYCRIKKKSMLLRASDPFADRSEASASQRTEHILTYKIGLGKLENDISVHAID